MAITAAEVINSIDLKPWSDPLKVIEFCKDMITFARDTPRVQEKNYHCLSSVIDKLENMKFMEYSDVIIVLRCYEFAKTSGYKSSVKLS